MSTLKEKLSETMKTSLKTGQKERLSYARNLFAVVRKKEIDDKIEIDDAGIQKIAQTSIKQRQESIAQFKAGNRMDLVEKEEAELLFLQEFVPVQMSEEEVKKHVEWAVNEAKATAPKDIGNVMKVLMPKVQGQADGKLINQLVRQKLGG